MKIIFLRRTCLFNWKEE